MSTFAKLAASVSLGLLLSACSAGNSLPLAGPAQNTTQGVDQRGHVNRWSDKIYVVLWGFEKF